MSDRPATAGCLDRAGSRKLLEYGQDVVQQGMLDALFQPFTLGRLSLPNRVVMAPMTRNRSPGGVPTDDVASYYAQRAAGGVGLIITEGTEIAHIGAGGYPDVPHFHGEAALAGWSKVVSATHQAGAKIMPQLWHVGSMRQPDCHPEGVPGFGPSAIVNPGVRADDPVVPHALTESEIADLIAAYASAAHDAETLGFDGVELHGAHGYLIDQFFWPKTNRREDAYGGDLQARTRFAREVCQAVRANVSSDYPIVFRFSQWKMGDYKCKIATTPEQLEQWLGPLVAAGVTILHASQRRYWEPEFDGSSLNLAGWTKKLLGVPTITVGSVGLSSDFVSSFGGLAPTAASIDALLERLNADEFDLVAVGRALLSDPDWAAKIRNQKSGDIRCFSPGHLKEFP